MIPYEKEDKDKDYEIPRFSQPLCLVSRLVYVRGLHTLNRVVSTHLHPSSTFSARADSSSQTDTSSVVTNYETRDTLCRKMQYVRRLSTDRMPRARERLTVQRSAAVVDVAVSQRLQPANQIARRL